jgi:hypothetical protein
LVFAEETPTTAQAANSDPDATQVVGLFQQSCFRFTGNATGLRDWASSRHLPLVPSEQAVFFLEGIGSGQVFGASTASGKHAVVSYDSGACQVIGATTNASAVKQLLIPLLRGQGVNISEIQQPPKPNASSAQEEFEAHLGARQWFIWIFTSKSLNASNPTPELHIMAAVNPT